MQATTLMTSQLNAKLPDLRPGTTVKVHQKIKEGDKERIQIFEGLIIAKKHGKGISATITVRKVVDGVGVERIFPMHSPAIEKIEIVKAGKVRRSKLYYLRTAKGTKSRLKKKEFAAAIAPQESPMISIEETPEEPVMEVLTETPTQNQNTKTEK
jgi:large subunit ribosomal protein L19